MQMLFKFTIEYFILKKMYIGLMVALQDIQKNSVTLMLNMQKVFVHLAHL